MNDDELFSLNFSEPKKKKRRVTFRGTNPRLHGRTNGNTEVSDKQKLKKLYTRNVNSLHRVLKKIKKSTRKDIRYEFFKRVEFSDICHNPIFNRRFKMDWVRPREYLRAFQTPIDTPEGLFRAFCIPPLYKNKNSRGPVRRLINERWPDAELSRVISEYKRRSRGEGRFPTGKRAVDLEYFFIRLTGDDTPETKRRMEVMQIEKSLRYLRAGVIFFNNNNNNRNSPPGPPVLVCKDVFEIILEYVEKDRRFLDRVGCVNEYFYLSSLRSWGLERGVFLKRANLRNVPVLVVLNARNVVVDARGFTRSDMRYLRECVKNVEKRNFALRFLRGFDNQRKGMNVSERYTRESYKVHEGQFFHLISDEDGEEEEGLERIMKLEVHDISLLSLRKEMFPRLKALTFHTFGDLEEFDRATEKVYSNLEKLSFYANPDLYPSLTRYFPRFLSSRSITHLCLYPSDLRNNSLGFSAKQRSSLWSKIKKRLKKLQKLTFFMDTKKDWENDSMCQILGHFKIVYEELIQNRSSGSFPCIAFKRINVESFVNNILQLLESREFGTDLDPEKKTQHHLEQFLNLLTFFKTNRARFEFVEFQFESTAETPFSEVVKLFQRVGDRQNKLWRHAYFNLNYEKYQVVNGAIVRTNRNEWKMKMKRNETRGVSRIWRMSVKFKRSEFVF